MSEKKRINGKIAAEIVDAVSKEAEREQRSASLMMEILLREALVVRGYEKLKK